jgi:hypothetical protein
MAKDQLTPVVGNRLENLRYRDGTTLHNRHALRLVVDYLSAMVVVAYLLEGVTAVLTTLLAC